MTGTGGEFQEIAHSGGQVIFNVVTENIVSGGNRRGPYQPPYSESTRFGREMPVGIIVMGGRRRAVAGIEIIGRTVSAGCWALACWRCIRRRTASRSWPNPRRIARGRISGSVAAC